MGNCDYIILQIDDSKCGGNKPWFQEACNENDCPTWTTSKWSGVNIYFIYPSF